MRQAQFYRLVRLIHDTLLLWCDITQGIGYAEYTVEQDPLSAQLGAVRLVVAVVGQVAVDSTKKAWVLPKVF